MSRDEPKLRLVHGGGSLTAGKFTAGTALVDDRFARRIGWQAIDEPALSDDYEDRLAARIFGGDCLALAGRAPRDAADAPVDDAPEMRGWSFLVAAAVALFFIGGAAVVTSPSGEATHLAPAPRLAPIEWPERAPDAIDTIHPPEVVDELPLDERPPVDLTAQPGPVPSPRPVPGPGASSAPSRLAVHAFERPVEEDSPGAVVERPAKEAEAEVAEADIVSPDGERPRLAAIVPRSARISPMALPGPVGIAFADPAGAAEQPTLRDHLSAAGHGDGTMAVLDIIGAGRQMPGRL